MIQIIKARIAELENIIATKAFNEAYFRIIERNLQLNKELLKGIKNEKL